jgi:hypothetical protein
MATAAVALQIAPEAPATDLGDHNTELNQKEMSRSSSQKSNFTASPTDLSA